MALIEGWAISDVITIFKVFNKVIFVKKTRYFCKCSYVYPLRWRSAPVPGSPMCPPYSWRPATLKKTWATFWASGLCWGSSWCQSLAGPAIAVTGEMKVSIKITFLQTFCNWNLLEQIWTFFQLLKMFWNILLKELFTFFTLFSYSFINVFVVIYLHWAFYNILKLLSEWTVWEKF